GSPLLLAGAVAAVLASTQSRIRLDVLRIDAVILAVAIGFVIDDPAEESLAHVPTSLLVRRALRIALTSPLLAVAWLQAVFLAPTGPLSGSPVSGWTLTLELFALVIWCLALAASLARFVPERFGGIAAGPTLLVLVSASFALPSRFALWLTPDDVGWRSSHHLWQIALVFGVAAFTWFRRDPWRRGLLRGGPRPGSAVGPQDARRVT